MNSNFTPSCLADSATIKFATEPSNVKFPANVDDIAKINQAFSGLINWPINGLKSITAGTFETILLNAAAEKANNPLLPFANGSINSNNFLLKAFLSIEPVIINKLAKNTNNDQSISRKTLCGFNLRVTSKIDAAVKAESGSGKFKTIITTNINPETIHLINNGL